MFTRVRRLLWRHKIISGVLLLVAAGFALTPVIVLTRTYLIVHPDRRPAALPAGWVLEEQVV